VALASARMALTVERQQLRAGLDVIFNLSGELEAVREELAALKANAVNSVVLTLQSELADLKTKIACYEELPSKVQGLVESLQATATEKTHESISSAPAAATANGMRKEPPPPLLKTCPVYSMAESDGGEQESAKTAGDPWMAGETDPWGGPRTRAQGPLPDPPAGRTLPMSKPGPPADNGPGPTMKAAPKPAPSGAVKQPPAGFTAPTFKGPPASMTVKAPPKHLQPPHPASQPAAQPQASAPPVKPVMKAAPAPAKAKGPPAGFIAPPITEATPLGPPKKAAPKAPPAACAGTATPAPASNVNDASSPEKARPQFKGPPAGLLASGTSSSSTVKAPAMKRPPPTFGPPPPSSGQAQEGSSGSSGVVDWEARMKAPPPQLASQAPQASSPGPHESQAVKVEIKAAPREGIEFFERVERMGQPPPPPGPPPPELIGANPPEQWRQNAQDGL